jgi:serine/threonine-protein kinase HipA
MEGRLVGTLATTDKGLVAFAYDEAWLTEGFSISPLSLPLEPGVFLPRFQPFEGIFGVFDDSLPDGWGRMLVDRMLRKQGVKPATIDQLTRLAIVGASGMGALTYEPAFDLSASQQLLDFDALADECARILADKPAAHLDEVFALGGSSGGARPKVLTEVDGESWIIKFFASMDAPDAGLMEYEYASATRVCGIEMPETHLFASKRCPGYFGVRRFDRTGEVNPATGHPHRVHMVSAGALLETSHRIPNLDYLLLARLTLRLTDSLNELERLYRLMCFNVFAHNRDDHAKNFAFVCDPATGIWRLSPAFDLTWSPGMGGEHATTVDGKGTSLTLDDLVSCGMKMGLPSRTCRLVAHNIRDATVTLVEKWVK